jgi:hypothetical protein
MKPVFPIIAEPIPEAQRLIALQMGDAPKCGSITIKAVFHDGFCRRLAVKRKTAKQLNYQGGNNG